MPKYKVLVQPSGLINGVPWPEVGETVELDEALAEAMVGAGHLEAAKDEPKKGAEKKVETRPAAKAGEEKR
jgi:hypothetical protein